MSARLLAEIRLSDGAPQFNTGRLSRLLDAAARAEGVAGELGVWLCDDDEIADLHQRFMSIPGATDVMSFPGEGDYLGDIAVSFETAARQGREVGNSVAREVAYLVLHGLLHLAGYDDLTPAERARMIGRQDELFLTFEREAPGDWGA